MSKRDTYRVFNAINIKPTGNRMVVELEDKDETTASGLIISNMKDDGITTGTVLAIGKGTHDSKGKFTATTVKPGHRIIFNQASGDKFNHQDMDYLWLEEHEVMGVLS
jgi:chaperonin GroES